MVNATAQITDLQATDQVWAVLADVLDPEVPALSVVDLGIIRRVEATDTTAEIDVTPTYTGCPATALIEELVKAAVETAGFEVTLRRVLSPAWTTDWISAEGRKKLLAYGIAPPEGNGASRGALFGADPVLKCPHCGSDNTAKVSEFGSTACKALYRCDDCLEPFEYFKCI